MFALFMWFQKESQLATLAPKNDWGLKKYLDKGNLVSVTLMDLLKAFDTINDSLLLAKLEAYGFSLTSLEFLQSYLCKRFKRTAMNGPFSSPL